MNKKYPWKEAIITGLIVAVFAIVSFTIADKLNKHFTWRISTTTVRGITGLLTLVILGVGIYSGMQSTKRSNSGKLAYGHAVFCGFIIAITAGIITALASLIYCQYINPGYLAYMSSETKKDIIASGTSPAEIEANLHSVQRQWTIGAQMIQALLGQTVCGTVIAFIMGLILRTKNN